MSHLLQYSFASSSSNYLGPVIIGKYDIMSKGRQKLNQRNITMEAGLLEKGSMKKKLHRTLIRFKLELHLHK